MTLIRRHPLAFALTFLLVSAVVLLIAVLPGSGQAYNAFQQTTFSSVTTAAPLVENTVILYHQLSWSGTPTACQVSIDSSPDNSAWTVGGILAAQTCTSAGSSVVVGSLSANYVRVNVSTFSGTAVIITYKGWTVNPAPGSGTGSVTNITTTAPLSGGPITTTGSITCPTCVITNGPNTITTGVQDFTGATSHLVPTAAVADSSAKTANTAFVGTAVANAIAAVNPAVAVQAASAAVLPNSPIYSNGVAGIGATLTTATTNVALVVDGYTPLLSDRVLVKNQASAFQNGVYTVTQLAGVGLAWILTRALDADAPSDMNNTGAIPVVNGTANTKTQWLQTSTVNTVGTDAVTFTQFSLNLSTAGAGTVFSNSTSASAAPGFGTSFDLQGYPLPSVVAYGADKTGVADSATAITNAIAACPTNGGIVYFPPGTYKYNSQITVNKACTLMAFGREAKLQKGYSGNAALLFTASNSGMNGLEYDGNNGGPFTGSCLVIGNGTSPVNIRITNNYIHNCDGISVYVVNAPSYVYIEGNRIVGGVSNDAIFAEMGVSHLFIDHNFVDGSAETAAGPHTIAVHATSASIDKVNISDNDIIAPIPATTGGFCVETGVFGAANYPNPSVTNMTIHHNQCRFAGANSGCYSDVSSQGMVATDNQCDANGFAMSNTAYEVIFETGGIWANNTATIEQSGAGVCFSINGANDTSISNNSCIGWGENGGSAIILGDSHAQNAVSTASSATSGGVVTVTMVATASLNTEVIPGSSVNIAGVSPAGYNCQVCLVTGKTNATTFTYTVPAAPGAYVSGGTINASNQGMVIANNILRFPVNNLVGTVFGIRVRPLAAGEISSNNIIKNNIIDGVNLVAGTTGLQFAGSAVSDSNVASGNQFSNLGIGAQFSFGTNNRFLPDNLFNNVTTPISGSTGLILGASLPISPTISSGFGTSPSITTNNGTAAFTINVGTGGVASSGVIGFPTSANGWVVSCFDVTSPTTGGGINVKQTASSTTTATITGYNATPAATAWTASDILHCIATAR